MQEETLRTELSLNFVFTGKIVWPFQVDLWHYT